MTDQEQNINEVARVSSVCRQLKAERDESREQLEKHSNMLGRISVMIPAEFFGTRETTVETAIKVLLTRYYSEMSSKMYEQYDDQIP